MGTVYVGIAYAGSESEAEESGADDGNEQPPWTVVEHYQFDGDRTAVKEQAVERALTDTVEQIRALEE